MTGIIGRKVGEVDLHRIGRFFPEALAVSEAERERRKRGTLDHRIGGDLAELATQGLLGAITAQQHRRLRVLRVLHDLAADTALQGRPRTGDHDGEPLPFDGIAPVDDHLAVLRIMLLEGLNSRGQETLEKR